MSFGGREDYYNNGFYRHVYKDRIFGTPMFLTRSQLLNWADNGDGSYILNNRVQSHHFGLRGWIRDNLSYRAKFTFTRNKGQWQEYGGRWTWAGVAIDPDYDWYWKGSKDQYYSLLEFNYMPKALKNISLDMGLGYDFGDIYTNFGGILGITYQVGM